MPDNRPVTARFYAPDAQHVDDVIQLPSEEAEHLARVLRLKSGASIRVFNGRGGEFEGVVESVTRDRVAVRVGAARAAASEPRVAVTLAQAVLKGDKMDEVVRDAVMMGVAAIQPVVTARSEVALATLERGRRRDRWQRIAISSAKQCGRAVVPHVLAPSAFSDVAAALAELTLPGPALMLVEPSAAAETATLGDLPAPSRETTLLIGPEGGWAAEEIDRGAATARLVTLGSRTIRADAMALVALAALFANWKEL
jgi:16S rRNA (uracil1498-N3)-methyltransferase